MFVETVQGIAAAAELYKQRATIGTALVRLKNLLINGNIRVAVFGDGGTGKSTLGSLLSGALDTDAGASDYAETLEIESFKIAGLIPGKLMVAPGQSRRRPSTWDELYRELSNGKSLKVINVVAWGYHATQLEKSKLLPGQSFRNDADFIRTYLERQRQQEIDALREIVPHLKGSPGRLRMITFVNKQDLWWDHRSDAKDAFEKG